MVSLGLCPLGISTSWAIWKLYEPCLCGFLWRHHYIGLNLYGLGGRTQQGLSLQIPGLSVQYTSLQDMGRILWNEES